MYTLPIIAKTQEVVIDKVNSFYFKTVNSLHEKQEKHNTHFPIFQKMILHLQEVTVEPPHPVES